MSVSRSYRKLWDDTHTTRKLRAGDLRGTDEPIVSIVGGPRPYLWIGNDGPFSKGCFGTISLPLLKQLIARAEAKNERLRKRVKGK